MMNWNDRNSNGRGSEQYAGPGPLIGYSVELSFRLEDGLDPAIRRRRVALVREAMKEVERTDQRLLMWEVLPPVDPTWIHIQARVEASQPGEVAALSEAWMRSAIAASNLAARTAWAQLPSPRDSHWGDRAAQSITAQVLAQV